MFKKVESALHLFEVYVSSTFGNPDFRNEKNPIAHQMMLTCETMPVKSEGIIFMLSHIND